MTDADTGFDAALDRLYGAALDEFVATRDALAKELRAGGDRETAAAVKKARKPSVAAWAVNQLARRHPDEVTALLEATEQLRRAQRRAVSGAGAGGLREAAAEQRAAVARLVERAGALLEETGHGGGAQLDRVASTLQAAPAGADTAERLARGRLERDLEPAGFGELEGLTLLTGDPGGDAPAATAAQVPTASAEPAPKAPAGQKEAAAGARRLEEAEAERERLRHDADAARDQAVRARAEADGAERTARQAAEAAARAMSAAKAAAQRAAAAEKAAEHAGRRAEAAAEAVAGARRALAAALARLEQ